MLPAIGKESATRASSAAMRVVVQPPPLLPIMITRLYPFAFAQLIVRITGSRKKRSVATPACWYGSKKVCDTGKPCCSFGPNRGI